MSKIEGGSRKKKTGGNRVRVLLVSQPAGTPVKRYGLFFFGGILCIHTDKITDMETDKNGKRSPDPNPNLFIEAYTFCGHSSSCTYVDRG